MIFTEVRCDKCGSVGLSRRCFYARLMREELKKAGWKHAEGGKDFCPECKPRRKPRRSSRTTVAAETGMPGVRDTKNPCDMFSPDRMAVL